jgi:hypothetical protein
MAHAIAGMTFVLRSSRMLQLRVAALPLRRLRVTPIIQRRLRTFMLQTK